MHPEIHSYLDRIEDLRGQILKLVQSLPPEEFVEAINWRPLEGSDDHATNSLGVLAIHSVGAEHHWIGEVIGGLPPTRNRDEEFVAQISSPEEIVQRFNSVNSETRQVFQDLSPEHLEENRLARDRMVPVRWSILHVIDHTALHLGQMQLTYQLWMGGKTAKSPRWYERLSR